jgi:LysR family glycine cleavage system transcriptional activator
MPTSDDLPPTSALRAFARAARTLSFKRAAEDLHVSPSALGRQIQSLEEHLGVALFRRLNPGLELSEAGRRYLVTVEHVLSELRSAQRGVAPGIDRPLRISALESFSASWLVPNLPDFEGRHPEVALEIEATLRYADFDRDPVDVAIRFGTGPWDGLHSEPLLDLEFFPVCSPLLLRGESPLEDPAHLAHHCLIHVSQTPDAWAGWLSAAGLAGLVPAREVTYDHVGIALSAAGSGQGVALSAPLLCERELSEGRLVAPFELRAPSAQTYHFVCREGSLDDPRVIALRDWLVDSLDRPA